MRALFFTLILFPVSAIADLSGRVVAVHDGDTLTVVDHGRKVRVRLDGIDAPELAQRYGKSSRNALSRLCRGKSAAVAERGKDEEGNVLGSVTCDKTDASAEQVKRGYAWVFRTYLPLGSPLYELETNARLMQRGLWRDKDPTPPWEWRQQRPARKQSR
jgi:endonuclease YncB( thermonuclease family)